MIDGQALRELSVVTLINRDLHALFSTSCHFLLHALSSACRRQTGLASQEHALAIQAIEPSCYLVDHSRANEGSEEREEEMKGHFQLHISGPERS